MPFDRNADMVVECRRGFVLPLWCRRHPHNLPIMLQRQNELGPDCRHWKLVDQGLVREGGDATAREVADQYPVICGACYDRRLGCIWLWVICEKKHWALGRP